MSVIILSGKIGSGKSYEAVEQYLIPALKKGRKVYTNLEIEPENLDYIAALVGCSKDALNLVVWPHYDYEYLRENLHLTEKVDGKASPVFVEENSMVILDEAQNVYGNKDWAKVPRAFDEWIGHVRHWGVDVVMITQNPKRLYKGIQQLPPVHIWRFKNLGFLGSQKRYSAKCFLEIGYRDCVKGYIRKYRPEIFSCYKSVVSKKILRGGIQHANLLISPKALLLYGVLIAIVFLVASNDWLGGYGKGETERAVAEKVDVAGVVDNVKADTPNSGRVVGSQEALQATEPPQEGLSVMQRRSILILGLLRAQGEPGFVLYRYLDDETRRYRALSYEFDRICRCNALARLQAGDILDITEAF